MRMMRNIKIVALVAMLSVAWCSKSASAAETATQEQKIIVSAAASLTNALTEIGNAFEQAEPSVKVTFNFASSGALLQQMAQGAPVDVFISANQKFMDDAQAKQLILQETRKNFAGNAMVLITPSKATVEVKTVKDLGKPEIQRIAIGDPESVPAGQYAKEAFEGYQAWDKIREKLVYGSDVRQVLNYVSRGEVEAGVVFATDALLQKDAVSVVMTLEHHALVVYPLAIAASTTNKDAATRFTEFVMGEKGQEILRQFGFTQVE